MITIVLWILQVLLAVTFTYHGYLKFVPPADLPFLAWLYDIPLGLRIFIGVAEFAAVIGLILPGVMKTHTWLTPLAALGLVINMISAIIFHIPRGEIVMIQEHLPVGTCGPRRLRALVHPPSTYTVCKYIVTCVAAFSEDDRQSPYAYRTASRSLKIGQFSRNIHRAIMLK